MMADPELKKSVFDPKTQPVAYIKDMFGNIVFRFEINLEMLANRVKEAEGELVASPLISALKQDSASSWHWPR